MYLNNGKRPLYVVKRRDREIYHCGSFSSATPKLYLIGYAKTECKKLNKWLTGSSGYNEPIETFTQWRSHNKWRMEMKDEAALESYNEYLDFKEGGPWIVAELQLAASEIKID